MKKFLLATLFCFGLGTTGFSQEKESIQIFGGVVPSLTMTADHYPRTEAGTGALMPWANRLWVITYVAHLTPTGSGTGLYEIDNNMVLKKHPASVVGTYANRLIHTQSMQLSIGPYLIDTLGNVRLIEEFTKHRLAATMSHLTDPENKLYFMGNGDFRTFKTISVKPGEYVHYEFPDAYSANWMRFFTSKDCKATAIIIYN